MKTKRKPMDRMRMLRAPLYTLAYNMPLSLAERTSIMARIHAAYDELRAGRGTEDHFDRVAGAVNVGLIRAETIGQEAVAVVLAAKSAMLSCYQIHADHGRFGFHGKDFEAIADFLDLYSQILELSTSQQMHDAQQEAHRRIAKQQELETA